MARYEVLALTIPEATEDEIRSFETQLQSCLRTAKGSLISFERWGKYRLAYPVRKHDYGVYFLARFELPESSAEVLSEMKSFINVKFHEVIVRSIISVLSPDDLLAYQRPPSLEEAVPRREGSSFSHSHEEDDHGHGNSGTSEDHEGSDFEEGDMPEAGEHVS